MVLSTFYFALEMLLAEPIEWKKSFKQDDLKELQGQYITLDALGIEVPADMEKFRAAKPKDKGMKDNCVFDLFASGRLDLLKEVHILLFGKGKFFYLAQDLGFGRQHGGLSHEVLTLLLWTTFCNCARTKMVPTKSFVLSFCRVR